MNLKDVDLLLEKEKLNFFSVVNENILLIREKLLLKNNNVFLLPTYFFLFFKRIS